MAITQIGVKVSLSPDFDRQDDITVLSESGSFGDNKMPVGGLSEGTQYYAKGWFVQDGIKIETDRYSTFTTRATDDDRFRFENADTSPVFIELSKHGSPNNITLSYSADGSTWSTWDSSVHPYVFEYEIPVGGSLYLKGDNWGTGNHAFIGNNASWQFTADGDVECHGNIMYLVDSTGQSLTAKPFSHLFDGMAEHLLTAPELPATTLATNCYSYLFNGCISLVDAPELPATSLVADCYMGIFMGCTSLVNTPELPATVMAQNCYANMFYGCTSVTVQPTLVGTVLASGCYQGMFRGTSITRAQLPPIMNLETSCYLYMYADTLLNAAPALPATRMFGGAYTGMFKGCTRLTQAPALPATRGDIGYNSMFEGCTSLIHAPALPATTGLVQAAYESMFEGCTSLIHAPALPATELPRAAYHAMFYGCRALSQAPALPATSFTGGQVYYEMFKGCTSLTVPPATLPATSLLGEDYADMFYGCTSLEESPAIYASPTATYCFNRMFDGNSGALKKITVYSDSWNVVNTSSWTRGSAGRGDFYNLGGATIPSYSSGAYKDAGIPYGWTVHTSL